MLGLRSGKSPARLTTAVGRLSSAIASMCLGGRVLVRAALAGSQYECNDGYSLAIHCAMKQSCPPRPGPRPPRKECPDQRRARQVTIRMKTGRLSTIVVLPCSGSLPRFFPCSQSRLRGLYPVATHFPTFLVTQRFVVASQRTVARDIKHHFAARWCC